MNQHLFGAEFLMETEVPFHGGRDRSATQEYIDATEGGYSTTLGEYLYWR